MRNVIFVMVSIFLYAYSSKVFASQEMFRKCLIEDCTSKNTYSNSNHAWFAFASELTEKFDQNIELDPDAFYMLLNRLAQLKAQNKDETRKYQELKDFFEKIFLIYCKEFKVFKFFMNSFHFNTLQKKYEISIVDQNLKISRSTVFGTILTQKMNEINELLWTDYFIDESSSTIKKIMLLSIIKDQSAITTWDQEVYTLLEYTIKFRPHDGDAFDFWRIIIKQMALLIKDEVINREEYPRFIRQLEEYTYDWKEMTNRSDFLTDMAIIEGTI